MLHERDAALHQQLDVHREEHVVVERHALDGRVVGADRRDLVVVDERHRVDAEPRLGELGASPVAKKSSHPVRTRRMSPARTSVPCAFGAGLELARRRSTWPGSSQSTPWWRGDVEQDAATREACRWRGCRSAARRRWR